MAEHEDVQGAVPLADHRDGRGGTVRVRHVTGPAVLFDQRGQGGAQDLPQAGRSVGEQPRAQKARQLPHVPGDVGGAARRRSGGGGAVQDEGERGPGDDGGLTDTAGRRDGGMRDLERHRELPLLGSVGLGGGHERPRLPGRPCRGLRPVGHGTGQHPSAAGGRQAPAFEVRRRSGEPGRQSRAIPGADISGVVFSRLGAWAWWPVDMPLTIRASRSRNAYPRRVSACVACRANVPRAEVA